jgi:hypothetical protein
MIRQVRCYSKDLNIRYNYESICYDWDCSIPSLLRPLLIIIRKYPVNKLDFNADYQIKYTLSNAARTGKAFNRVEQIKEIISRAVLRLSTTTATTTE